LGGERSRPANTLSRSTFGLYFAIVAASEMSDKAAYNNKKAPTRKAPAYVPKKPQVLLPITNPHLFEDEAIDLAPSGRISAGMLHG
jgi:hypothetical protein